MSDGEQARRRAEELARRPRRPSTPKTVKRAEQRLAEAHERARNAHLSSANAHELAAQAHGDAVAQNVGDVESHIRAAAKHRAARDEAYRAAEAE